MQKKQFSLEELTITDFTPEDLPDAKAAKPGQKPSGQQVPEGRTVLRIGGTATESAPSVIPSPVIESVPSVIRSPETRSAPPPEQLPATESAPAWLTEIEHGPDDDDDFEPETAETVAAKLAAPRPAPADRPAAQPRTETTAALHVRAQRPPKPKRDVAPEELVPMNLRIPDYLKSLFYKTCRDRGTTPSVVLRGLIKQYCAVSLVLAVLALMPGTAAAQARTDSTTYTTDQIMTYLQGKAFGGLGKNAPAAKGTVGARHALWQAGATDNVDNFVYTDHSNTRLEAKIEIPIFDLGYLRNRDKEKLEHRAFVMKSLSRILAAQKTVSTLESRITTVRARREYVNTQINLKLANRSDLFAIEDNIFTLQTQLFEAQSTLEQRVIELAVLAENDWREAYDMIIKWNGELFPKTGKGRK